MERISSMSTAGKPKAIDGGPRSSIGGGDVSEFDLFGGTALPENPVPVRKPKGKKGRSGAPSPVKRVETLARLTGAAVAVAVAAAGYGAYAFVTTGATVAELRDATVPVLTAESAIPAGTVIEPSMVETIDIPVGYAVDERLDGPAAAVGQRTLTDVPAGAQITESLFAGPSDTSTIANNIEAGSVAVTVSVDAENGCSGMIRQGDSVRVVGYEQTSDGGLDAVTLVASARVAALDASMTEALSSYSALTLEVSPEDANRVKAAQAAGTGGGVDIVLLSSADSRGSERTDG